MTKYTTEQKEMVGRLYREGTSVSSISEELNIPWPSIYAILKGLNIERAGPTKFTREQELQIILEIQSGEMKKNIAKKYGCGRNTIGQILRRHDIEPIHSGPGHHLWKGGEHINKDGYVFIKIPSDDPYISMAKSDRYIMKHRYIMAQYLGRSLLPHPIETVHHKDLNKQNNNISNLQLRQGNHGKGAVFECADCGSHNVVPRKL